MFSDAEKDLIRRSWKLVIPIADTAADLFYRRLFELRPDYRQLFPGDLSGQKHKLIRMLAFIVRSLDWSNDHWKDEVDPNDDLMLVILALGRRHAELYRIPVESYTPVGEALLWTLDYGLGEAFDARVREVWTKVYKLVAKTMIMGETAVDPAVVASSPEDAQRRGDEALQSNLVEAGLVDMALEYAEEIL